jgi:alanyl-tRNA synthetase
MLTSSEIRSRYLEFFKERGHAVIPSASLLPENDPTVLFNTAGMQPLVPYLLGEKHPAGVRLVSSQKCVRTGDIDDVGDNRHLTFFEMLGNWSLGDYFKTDSIRMSFEFLTSKDKGLGLDPDRLYVTVFVGDEDAPRDEESIMLWKQAFSSASINALVDVPIADGGRIFSLPKESNWWGPAGQTGPCGPDTEIFYDLGEGVATLNLEDGMPDFDSGRLIEIWNNVFMQYRKELDGSILPLEQNNVDTGMGLERITAVVNGVLTVFETDSFTSILAVIEQHSQANMLSRCIIADHMKAATFLIQDGAFPSNKDRGYVVRRIIRRAVLHAGLEDDLIALEVLVTNVVAEIAKLYSDAYQIIAPMVDGIIIEEARKFNRSLAKGKREIEKASELSGKQAFDLYQSYGFPLELTKEYAASKGVKIDDAEFEAEFKKHQDLSRTASAGQFSSGLADHSEQTVKYHTATHLLHRALKDVLGESVQQKGSNITGERLRFDFSHDTKMRPEEIQNVEAIVNDKIKSDLTVSRHEMSPQEASEQGYIGLFGHKYGDIVSTYNMGDYSKEICTGPHAEHTGALGIFKIQKEEAVSAGVRRIKAILQ